MPYRVPDRPMLTAPVVPLTRQTADGTAYTRRPEREAEIGDLVTLPTRTAQQTRLSTRAPDDAAVGSSPHAASAHDHGTHAESLAYFVRECRRCEDEDAGNWLAERVVERVDPFIHRHLRGLNETYQNAAYGQVIEVLFHKMRNLTDVGGEYYQISFWNGLDRRCNDAYRHYAGKSQWEARHIITPTAARGGDSDGELLDPLDRVADTDPLPDALPGDGDVVRRGLRHLRANLPGKLTEPQVDAFSLRYLADLPIGERDKPGTLAYRYDVTPRTINNWLRAVRDALGAWMQEETA